MAGNNCIDVIVIGASTGGVDAIEILISRLKGSIPPILIVQHMPENFTLKFANRLNSIYEYKTSEAKDFEEIEDNHIYIAPGNKHMTLIKKDDVYRVKCKEGKKTNGHVPSIDVLFESTAKTAGSRALGIILTGMGKDGAEGLLSLKKAGCITIGQDEKSSVLYGMPKAAYEIGAVKYQKSIYDISDEIIYILKRYNQ